MGFLFLMTNLVTIRGRKDLFKSELSPLSLFFLLDTLPRQKGMIRSHVQNPTTLLRNGRLSRFRQSGFWRR